MIIPNKLLKHPVALLTQAIEIYVEEGSVEKAAKKGKIPKEGLLELIKSNKDRILTCKEDLFREKLFNSMKVLHRKIEGLASDISEASPHGINALASALEKLYRVYALLGGQPSEIVEERKYEQNLIATYNVHEVADSLKDEIFEWFQNSQKGNGESP